MQELSLMQRVRSMADKFIRKAAAFNRYSEREMKIWNWILERTDNFKKESFASFARESFEFKMKNEGKEFKKAEPMQEQPNKKGWGSLL
jgi:hypothetical protein